MTKRLTIIVMVLSFFAASACKQPSTNQPANTGANRGAAATPDQFANARGLYAKDCQTCHGATGGGGPVKLDDGTKLKVPSLREGHALRHSDEEFTKQITKGGDGMPAFADKLTSNQMNDLIRFIRHEFQAGAQSQSK